MHIGDRPVVQSKPSLERPSLRERSVSSPPKLESSPSRSSVVKHKVEQSRSESQALQELVSPDVSIKVKAKAEKLGAEKINSNAQNPGFLDRIKNSALGRLVQQLFKSPPPYEAAQGGLVVPQDAEVVHEHDPGIKAKFAKDTMVFSVNPTEGASSDFAMVKKGDKCNVRKTNNPNIMYVEKYSYDAQKNMVVEASGFVFAKNITSHKQARSHKALDKNAAIFPKAPSPKDIKQGKMGDCFFLAGLSSIVASDPKAVTNMIKDNGNGTVTVKLFDVEGQGDAKTFKPKYITFDKSILHTDFSIREHADTSVPWVALMEKAYAIHKGSYTKLGEGGFANDVYEALLGKAAVKEPVAGASLSSAIGTAFAKDHNTLFPDGESAQKMSQFAAVMVDPIMALITKANEGKASPEDLQQLLDTRTPISFNPVIAKAFKESLVSDLNLDVQVAQNLSAKILSTFKFGLESVPTREAFIEKIDKLDPPLTPEVREALLKHANPVELTQEMKATITEHAKGFFSGPRGSGEYSQPQQALFSKISDGLQSGKIMGTGTLHKIQEDDGGNASVGTAGEEVVKGLVGGHDFSITGAVELKPGDDGYPGPIDGKPLKFIKVRNPWGTLPSGLAIIPSKLLNYAGIPEHGSRIYSYNDKTGKLDAKGSREAEYLVEMSDFTRHFEDIYYTT